MNNDYLRVNSKDEQEGIVEGEYSVKTETVDEKRTTLYSLLKNKKGVNGNFADKIPNVPRVLSLLAILASVAMFLLLIAFITKKSVILIAVSVTLSLAIPVAFCVFFYEINDLRNVSISEVLGGFAVGMFFYVIASQINVFIADRLYDFEWLSDIIRAGIIDLGLVLLSFFFVKLAKKVNMFASFLLVISVFAGFIFMNGLINMCDSLFYGVQINGEQPIRVFAIIESGEYFNKITSPFIINALVYGVYEALLYFAWAIICGGVISLKESPVKGIYKDSSLYLLVILQLVLNILVSIGSSIAAFNIALNVVGFCVSVFIALKVLNFMIIHDCLKKNDKK